MGSNPTFGTNRKERVVRVWHVSIEADDGSGYTVTFDVSARDIIQAATLAQRRCEENWYHMEVVRIEMAFGR